MAVPAPDHTVPSTETRSHDFAGNAASPHSSDQRRQSDTSSTVKDENEPNAQFREKSDSTSEDPQAQFQKNGFGDGGNEEKIEITEEDCADELGFAYPTWKKWMILSIIFLGRSLYIEVLSRAYDVYRVHILSCQTSLLTSVQFSYL